MRAIIIILFIILCMGTLKSCSVHLNWNQQQLLTKGIIYSKEHGTLNGHHVSDSIFNLYQVGDKIETYKLYGLEKRDVYKSKIN